MNKLRNLIFPIMIVCLLSACNNIKTVDYVEPKINSSQETIENTIGKANEENTNEDGSISYIYKKSKYMDYMGKMTYQSFHDTIVFSRWEYEAKDHEDGEEVYKTICSDMEKNSQKGEEASDELSKSCTYMTDSGSRTVSLMDDETTVNVSITYIGQQ